MPADTAKQLFRQEAGPEKGTGSEGACPPRPTTPRPTTETADQLFREGNLRYRAKDLSAAAQCYLRALEIDPELAAASFNLGCTLDSLAGPGQALPYFAKAASLRPDWCDAHANLGFALARIGRMAEAVAEFETAVSLRPEDAGIMNNLGLALAALGRGEQACASFREAIRLNPHYPEAHNNLASLFERYGRTSDAIEACLKALELRPDYPEAHNNLGCALKSQGRHREALAHFQEALRLRPGFGDAYSSLLFSLCYPAGLREEEVSAAHLAFGAAHSFSPPSHDNAPTADRVIKIGYVSADFRSHAVARFIEPVLRHHDRNRFRIFCYSNVSVPDATSVTIAGLADSFVNIAGVADEEVCSMIRSDAIDILVDLSGHTADNRLLVFARKPAPVQVTWLGYPHTTGLKAIDYRITDRITDPPGASAHFYAEKLVRLSDNFSCFAPPEDAPAVSELPVLSAKRVTFGSFNNPAKITSETVALWAAVLNAVPSSAMLIKGYSLADPGSRQRLVSLFAEHGIAAERLELAGNTPTYREHLALYGNVDIALDTFPYNGTTTTCEALWMGVPVVTLTGDTHRSRVGASILASVGLDQLVARDEQAFRQAAVELAMDLNGLNALRTSLRQRMESSSLTDGAGFTIKLESAFRDIWHRWCSGKGKSPLSPLCQGGDLSAPFQQKAAAITHSRDIPSPEGGGPGRGNTAGNTDGAPPSGRMSQSDGCDRDAQARQFLQQGLLDSALQAYLESLKSKGTRSAALGGIQELIRRQMAADMAEALNRDAIETGAELPRSPVESIRETTLEETAHLLLAAGIITPVDLICRYLHDRGHHSRSVSRTLGEVAVAIGEFDRAVTHFKEAIGAGDRSIAVGIQLAKAEELSRLKRGPEKRERFLLIKAWGYGFWSDVFHVLGQLLLAEMTGRVPIVHWGGNSLFSDDPCGNAFENFFESVSRFTIKDIAQASYRFYPPKWNHSNLATPILNQMDGPWSCCSALSALNRAEDVVVSDFHYSVHDLVPWIRPEHRLHGLTADQVCLDLCRRYLQVKPSIVAKADAFFAEAMAGGELLAVHVRGGDKGGEDPNLARLNALYHPEIERYLRRSPRARLYLMTDDRDILSGYLDRYGDMVITTSATRTDSASGVHYQHHPSRRRLGEEVLIDALLALRCQAFLGNGLSNVSCAIAQMKEWAPGTCKLLGARLDRVRNVTMYRS